MKKQYLIPEVEIIRFDSDSDILTLSWEEGSAVEKGEGFIGGWLSGNEAPSDSTEVKSIFD